MDLIIVNLPVDEDDKKTIYEDDDENEVSPPKDVLEANRPDTNSDSSPKISLTEKESEEVKLEIDEDTPQENVDVIPERRDDEQETQQTQINTEKKDETKAGESQPNPNETMSPDIKNQLKNNEEWREGINLDYQYFDREYKME